MSLDLLSTDEALRLECARIASARGDVDPARTAGRLYDFVKGAHTADAVPFTSEQEARIAHLIREAISRQEDVRRVRTDRARKARQ